MSRNHTHQPTPPVAEARTPLGQRPPAGLAATVRRITGQDTAPQLDVAAFNSFTD